MKSVRYYLELLKKHDEQIAKSFALEFYLQNNFEDLVKYMDFSFTSYSMFIRGYVYEKNILKPNKSFSWSFSSLGYSYWDKVCRLKLK